MSAAWESGSSPAWRRIREQVLLDANYLCQVRLACVCTEHATQVHHTQGKAVTGLDRRYLVASCAPCNQRVGDPAQETAHARIVSWVRDQRWPVSVHAIDARFRDVNVSTRSWVLKRAVQRGELERVGGVYRKGPTAIAKVVEPKFEPRTKW